MLHVVMGVIIDTNNNILIARRQACQEGAGLWEFPGGKVELGETPFEALVREFREEIGIVVLKATPFIQLTHQYPKRKIFLDTWLVDAYQGVPCGNEGQVIKWVAGSELDTYDYPAGNVGILAALKKRTQGN